MRRLKLMVLAVGAAMVMLVGLAGPAGAADPPGRGASTRGLVTALGKVTLSDVLISNIAMAQDPNQPGVTPGGGGGCTPETC